MPRTDQREADEPLSIVTPSAAFIEPIDTRHREAMVAEAAYYLAERRSFDPGHELDDWLAAEQQIERSLGGPGCAASG